MFNILLEDEFCEHRNMSFSHNNNFEKNRDYQSQFIGEDGIHLSETGVKVYMKRNFRQQFYCLP